MSVIRVTLFQDWPETILVRAPEGCELRLPVLTPPFTKKGVADAFGAAGIPVRIVETVAGRWTAALQHQDEAARRERHAEQRMRVATEAMLSRQSPSQAVRTRAEALLQKQEVDDQLRVVKEKLAAAKARVITHGVYMPVHEYRKLESRLARLKQDSQALQALIGELGRAERQANVVASGNELRAFKRLARERLDPETFEALERESRDLDGDDDEEEPPARGLSGTAKDEYRLRPQPTRN